jgi:methionine-rich copper-binding protein CopC
MNLGRKTFVLALALACFKLPVWGHAILLKATPAVNQEVTGANTAVELRFNSRIDAKRSKLTLIGPDSHEHALAISEQSSPDALSSRATDLTPGSYVLRWQVLAQDGHITRGEVPFKVH